MHAFTLKSGETVFIKNDGEVEVRYPDLTRGHWDEVPIRAATPRIEPVFKPDATSR